MEANNKEKRLLGDLLDDDEEAEESKGRYASTKRNVLLDRKDIEMLNQHRHSAPISEGFSSGSFFSEDLTWGKKPKPPPAFNTTAQEFVPSFEMAPQVAYFAPPQTAPDFIMPNPMPIHKNGGSKDSVNSRILQQRLQIADNMEKQMIFDSILPESYFLMKDQFGNYLIQKFFEYGLEAHKDTLLKIIVQNVIELSFDTYGCRVVQKALDYDDLASKNCIQVQIQPKIEEFMNDSNANHVVQKLVEVLHYDQLEFIINVLNKNIVHWATHTYGCRIIQKFIEYFPIEKTQGLIELVFDFLLDICKDSYGNYVVQHIIEFSTDVYKNRFYTAIEGQIIHLSCHKFASNVIEKCIHFSPSDRLSSIAREIFRAEADVLTRVMTDKYGNYVIQKVIETATGDLKAFVLANVMTHESKLKEFVCGKHILACVEKVSQTK